MVQVSQHRGDTEAASYQPELIRRHCPHHQALLINTVEVGVALKYQMKLIIEHVNVEYFVTLFCQDSLRREDGTW